MRQGFVRGLALWRGRGGRLRAHCDPRAAGDGGTTTARAAATTAPSRPLTWSDVAGRLRQQGRLTHDHAAASVSARATASEAGAPTASVADATPTLTVTPSTGLEVGDRVDVTGAGFVAGDDLVLECRTGATDPGPCAT